MDNQFKTDGQRYRERLEKTGTTWTGIGCDECGANLTNHQLAYSRRVFGRPLCYLDQQLQRAREGVSKK
jgi:hypothetical protein